MSKYRTAAKRDSNERDIIEALQQVGCFVLQATDIDLFVLPPNADYWIPMEVKTRTGRLTDYQKTLHQTLAETYHYEIPIVTTIDEALQVIGIQT